MNRRRVAKIAATACVLGVLTVGGSASALAQDLPGGKAYFTIALSNIPLCATSPCTGSGPYWSRLANYAFTASTGTVAESFWFWSQSTESEASNTGVTSSGCSLTCNVHAPYGFEDHNRTTQRPYPKDFTGTYTLVGSTLTITWQDLSSEVWTVSNPISTLAQLTFVSSTYGVQFASGWGSNANPNTSGVTMSAVNSLGLDYNGEFVQNDGGTTNTSDTSAVFNWSTNAWATCNTDCAQLEIAGCSGMDSLNHIGNLPSNLRKNAYEYHCSTTYHCPNPPINVDCNCGSGGTEHPHLYAAWQIIDDSGAMRGWVMAQASLFAASAGSNYIGAAYYVNLN